MKIRRSEVAQAILEVVLGVICIIPVLIVLLDLFVIFLGVQMNESLCANAVRVVASGAPEDAEKRARIVIGAEKRSNGLITGFSLVPPLVIKLEQSSGAEPLEQREPALVAGPVRGTATVTTEVEICPILVHRFYGGDASFRFRSEKSSPLRFVRQSLLSEPEK